MRNFGKIRITLRSQGSEDRMKRPATKSFQDLIVWQKAHQFVLSAYRQSENFPNWKK